MKIITLDQGYIEQFKAYCRKYKYVHDESYLYDEDLDDFQIGEKNPTKLLMDNGKIVGVISLIVSEYFTKANKTRVRIFHCEETSLDYYKLLMESVLPLNEEIQKIEMYLPVKLRKTQAIIEDLLFTYNRTSYVMVRKNKEAVNLEFDQSYELKPFREDIDEETYCHVRNVAFATLKGSEVPITEAMAKEQYQAKDLLKDGMQILWHMDKPVGVVRMLHELDEGQDYSFVAPIALIPEYQGKGLGGKLLQAGIYIGQQNGYDNSMLSVNGENEHALTLYKRLGYEIDFEVSNFVKKL